MTATDDHGGAVPAWQLERYVLGELPPDQMERLRQREETDAQLRQRVEALRQSGDQILAAYPAPWVARQIRARAQAARRGDAARVIPWGPAWVSWAAPLAAAALLAVVAVPLMRSGPEVEESGAALRQAMEGVRIKGGPRLVLHRKTAAGSQRLEDGAAVRQGDLIRVQYDAAGAGYGAIVSVDGRGAVTRHLPASGPVAARLAEGVVSLEAAYDLDDAPRWERFILVTGHEPFGVEAVLAAVRAAAGRSAPEAPDSLSLPAGLSQTGFTLVKVEGSP